MSKHKANASNASHKPEQILLTWQAADRPYKKRDVQFYFNVAAIGVIITLILFFFAQYVLIATLFALIFVVLVMATVPPKTIPYQITSWGIRVDSVLTPWEQLTEFWQDQQLNHTIFILRQSGFLHMLVLVADSAKVNQISDALEKHITQTVQPKESWIDRRSHDLVRLTSLGQK